ncbi:hypothetical protein ADL19_05755 [Streptomyces purpurogeneiscleroticus]|nr:hypothetical protein ADL19_05755 [Streptomyces purpurogeneiscleroticus]
MRTRSSSRDGGTGPNFYEQNSENWRQDRADEVFEDEFFKADIYIKGGVELWRMVGPLSTNLMVEASDHRAPACRSLIRRLMD